MRFWPNLRLAIESAREYYITAVNVHDKVISWSYMPSQPVSGVP